MSDACAGEAGLRRCCVGWGVARQAGRDSINATTTPRQRRATQPRIGLLREIRDVRTDRTLPFASNRYQCDFIFIVLYFFIFWLCAEVLGCLTTLLSF